MPAAIYFAPDAFVLDGKQIMGRRVAGASFLRAAVEGRVGEPLLAYTDRGYFGEFQAAVGALDAEAPTRTIALGDHAELARCGTLFRSDPVIGPEARLRLRSGPARFSLCGVTHTLMTSHSIEAIAALASEPVMPWDALICTSTVARDVVRSIFDDAADYIGWRSGVGKPVSLPYLPLIPLGLHSKDLAPTQGARHRARTRFAIGENERVVLFAGRLAIASKAHPFQMYQALQAVAGQTGKPVTLMLAGQFFNDRIAEEFANAARRHCPDVRYIVADGADAQCYADAFAAADIFLSLADSYQETFGLTPLEGMAMGLPVVVSDWNGYRDTVRDGVDGFRIACMAPAEGAGAEIARDYELTSNYDLYAWRTATTVSIDMKMLIDRLTLLVEDKDLRRRMGEAGRARAVGDYDWSVIYPRYKELWAELAAMRMRSINDDRVRDWLGRAPRAHPVHRDPFGRFATFPTGSMTGETLVRAAPGASVEAYDALVSMPMFGFHRLRPDLIRGLLSAPSGDAVEISAIAREIARPTATVVEWVSRLVKMNLLIVE